MPEPKPIPTKCNGVQYRSRLEARWALFFDQLGIDYRYEYEGFQLRSGWYVPDFYLPNHGWFEIKPREPNEEERKHGWDMACEQPDKFYILTGFPLEKTHDANYDCDILGNLWMENHETGEVYFAPNAYYKRDKEHHLEYDFPFLEVESCVHCTNYHTCSLFGHHKGRLLVQTHQFLVDCHPSTILTSDMNNNLDTARNKVESTYSQLYREHDGARVSCKYRKSNKIDSAYQFAKNFRFF